MFLELTNYRNKKKIFVNFNYVTHFNGGEYTRASCEDMAEEGPCTILQMTYGNKVVRETPEQIMEMLNC